MRDKSVKNIFIASLSIYFIFILKDVLTPFIIALFIAYLINPFINLIQNKLCIKNRGLAISIGISSSLIVLSTIILIITPIINQEFKRASILLREYADIIPPIPDEINNKIINFLESDQRKDFINSSTINEVFNKITHFLKSVYSESINFLKSVLGVFFVLLYLVFILIEYPKFKASWKKWIPNKYRDSCQEIATELNNNMQSYFRGQATVAFIVGIMFCLGFKIIGLPLAILLGVFLGILNLVPYMQILGLIPAFILSIMHSLEINQNIWITLGITSLIFLLIQIVQEAILIPKIMNKVIGLNPAIILLSLSIWGSLMGLSGLIIALPISSLLIAYYKRLVSKND